MKIQRTNKKNRIGRNCWFIGQSDHRKKLLAKIDRSQLFFSVRAVCVHGFHIVCGTDKLYSEIIGSFVCIHC